MHYRLVLYSRQPGDEGMEQLREAALVAAHGAADVLASGPFYGQEASVEFDVRVGDNTVPYAAPVAGNVVRADYSDVGEDEPNPDVEGSIRVHDDFTGEPRVVRGGLSQTVEGPRSPSTEGVEGQIE